jgi:hypothetical protein
MIHAGNVAGSVEELSEWIARTDDLRETLTKAGYGSAFTAEALFPLFQSYVAKAKRPVAAAAPTARGSSKWLWIVVVVAVVLIAIAIAVASRS